MDLTFGSVCSGIEAASVAWHPLGWRAAWLAEVDRAASDVLAYRFPEVPNLGDMTRIAEMIRRREIPAPDVLVGGTPCQGMSVAGLRGGLSDPRTQLSLVFIDIANAIDEIRAEDGKPAVVVVWENVPGALNIADNSFGIFVAGLVGDIDALEPGARPDAGRSSAYWTWDKKAGQHRPKWPDSGHAAGPKRSASWRVLDAQFFQLAQRRRRVFVVASAREGFDPAAILLEFEGVRRDSAPSREAGQGFTHSTAPCLTSSGRGVERTGDTRGQDPVVAASDDDALGMSRLRDGEFGDLRYPDYVEGLRMVRPRSEDGRVRQVAGPVVDVCPTLRAGGNATGGDRPPGTDVDTIDSLIVDLQNVTLGRDVCGTLDSEGQSRLNRGHGVLMPAPTWWDGRDVSQTLDAVLHKGQTMPEKNRFPAVLHPVAFSTKDYGGDAASEPGPTLRSMGHDGSHANGGGQVGVAYAFKPGQSEAAGGPFITNDVSPTLQAQNNGSTATPAVDYAIQERACADVNAGPGGKGWRDDDCAYTLEARHHVQSVVVPGLQPQFRCSNCGFEMVVKHDICPCCVIPFDTTQITSPSNYSRPKAGDPCHPLASGAHPPAVCVTEPVTHTLKAEGFDASEDGTGRGQPIVNVEGYREPGNMTPYSTGDRVDALTSANDSSAQFPIRVNMAVRRLLPVECERLQGFPDGWTEVPNAKGKPAADGPRYKQLGNSMATTVMHWIGSRIDRALSQIGHNGGPPLDDFDALL